MSDTPLNDLAKAIHDNNHRWWHDLETGEPNKAGVLGVEAVPYKFG